MPSNEDFVRAPQRTIPEEFSHLYTEEHRERRRRAMVEWSGWQDVDDLDPKAPSGHARGIAISTRLTTQYRQAHKSESMDVTPQQVIDVLVEAGVKNWVLMGLHGYVGYLPEPRATQDVDVMIPYSEKKRATKAVTQAWPELEVRELSQMVRFLDPNDRDAEGAPQPVLDLMLPWGKFQQTILEKFVVTDEATGHRVATLEAAIVSKYAAVLSSHRSWDRKEQDAVDLRKLVRANYKRLDRDVLRDLADQVWQGGGEEILQFVEIAMQDKPFPI
jgi:hypothetical protein